MDNEAQPQSSDILEPVDGKFIYQIDANIRIRFNADGWVEEIGKGGGDDPLGTKLQGKPGTKRDDLYVRRYYDLYSRVVLINIYPKLDTQRESTGGLIRFADLEAGSPIYERVNKMIAISNQAFNTDLKPL